MTLAEQHSKQESRRDLAFRQKLTPIISDNKTVSTCTKSFISGLNNQSPYIQSPYISKFTDFNNHGSINSPWRKENDYSYFGNLSTNNFLSISSPMMFRSPSIRGGLKPQMSWSLSSPYLVDKTSKNKVGLSTFKNTCYDTE